MQNDNYFGVTMKCKMLKFSESCLVPSKIQNLLPHESLLRLFLGFFFCLLSSKFKIKYNHLFAKNFT